MAENAFHVWVIERAHSTGSESRRDKVFLSIEGASSYLMDYFHGWCEDHNYPEDWDEEDMDASLPFKEMFSVEILLAYLDQQKKHRWHKDPIWGPESAFEAQRPIEFFLAPIKISP